MSLSCIEIKGFKSIKKCNITISNLNILIGENGSGKSNILEAIKYFYDNLTENNINHCIFDENNRYSNEATISLTYDLTQFVKIANKQIEMSVKKQIGENEKNKTLGLFNRILVLANQKKRNLVKLEMKQIKGKNIVWNFSYEDRFIFKSLYPLFYVDTRNLDIEQWENIWGVLGDLLKVSYDQQKKIEKHIIEDIKSEDKFMSEIIEEVNKFFEKNRIEIKTAQSKEFAQNLSRLIYAGNKLQKDGKMFEYYSTGTNSMKYLETLIMLVAQIAKFKLKNPIFVIDEPEIGLHSNYLDEISEDIVETSEKIIFLISTHSPRITKNCICNKENNTKLFNVKLVKKYTNVIQMRQFLQYAPNSQYRVMDDYVNSYFARAILFVEGETELELFSNPYLRILFPKLKKVQIMKAMSQKKDFEIMNPSKNKNRIPYICLIDMDKVFSFNIQNEKINFKKEFMNEENSKNLRYYYYDKKTKETLSIVQYKRLKQMEEKLKINFDLPYWSSEDIYYKKFLRIIHNYLLKYNIFTWNTTIEGALITMRTKDFVCELGKSKRDYSDFRIYWDKLKKNDQLNCLRYLYKGKSDLLQDKFIRKKLKSEDNELLEKMTNSDKTNGWVSEFWEEYFKKQCGIDNFSQKEFIKYLDNRSNEKDIKLKFKRDFEELSSLIVKLYDMI